MADNKIIHELLKEVRMEQKEADSKANKRREEAIVWHSETVRRLDKYNHQLEIHIDGVNTLKDLHNSNVDRLEILERPSKSWKYIGGLILKASAVAGLVITAAKLAKLL